MSISKHPILVLVVALALATLARSTHDDGVRCEGDLISYFLVGDPASESCMAECENDSECVAYGIYSTEPNDDICVDFDGWDYGGYADCSWYEDESQPSFFDDPGCPIWGGDEGVDGVTAWEACCYCGGGSNPRDDDYYSFSYDYDDDYYSFSYDYDDDYYSYDYDDDYYSFSYDYDDDYYSFSYGYDDDYYCVDFYWVGYGDAASCWWYEDESIPDYIDYPGCPRHGHDEDSMGVTAWEACCYCGGGSNPRDDDYYSFSYDYDDDYYSFSYDYDDDYYSFSYGYDDDDDLTPVQYCSLYRDIHSFTDGDSGDECYVMSTSPPSFVPSVAPSVGPSAAPSVGSSLAPSMYPTRGGKAKRKKKKKKEKKAKGTRRTF